MEQEHGAFDRGEGFEEDEEPHRERIGGLRVTFRVRPLVGEEGGSGSHVPTYDSRRTRAERRWSMHRRVVTVDRYALGDSIATPPIVSR